jgi:hypothetical protein
MHGHELLETFAAVALIALGAFFLPASWLARRNAPDAEPSFASRTDEPVENLRGPVSIAAASCLFGAAAIHFAVVQGHATADALLGQAFAAVAVWQVGVGIALVARLAWARPLAIATHVGVIAVWGLSRTIGLPVGPHPWVAERVATADLVATGLELASLTILAVAADRRLVPRHTSTWARQVWSVAAVPAVGVAGLLTLIALASLQGDPGHLHT